MNNLRTGFAADPQAARARWLVWLSAGATDLVWALGSIPPERWTHAPPEPARLGAWPPARHVRHLALAETRLVVPAVEAVLDERSTPDLPTRAELDQLNAAWDASIPPEAVEGLVDAIGEARFGLLQRLESAADDVWERPIPAGIAPGEAPARLEWLLGRARQHDLEHQSALWKLCLYWDRVAAPPTARVSLPLQPADRLEESH